MVPHNIAFDFELLMRRSTYVVLCCLDVMSGFDTRELPTYHLLSEMDACGWLAGWLCMVRCNVPRPLTAGRSVWRSDTRKNEWILLGEYISYVCNMLYGRVSSNEASS